MGCSPLRRYSTIASSKRPTSQTTKRDPQCDVGSDIAGSQFHGASRGHERVKVMSEVETCFCLFDESTSVIWIKKQRLLIGLQCFLVAFKMREDGSFPLMILSSVGSQSDDLVPGHQRGFIRTKQSQ